MAGQKYKRFDQLELEIEFHLSKNLKLVSMSGKGGLRQQQIGWMRICWEPKQTWLASRWKPFPFYLQSWTFEFSLQSWEFVSRQTQTKPKPRPKPKINQNSTPNQTKPKPTQNHTKPNQTQTKPNPCPNLTQPRARRTDRCMGITRAQSITLWWSRQQRNRGTFWYIFVFSFLFVFVSINICIFILICIFIC